MTAEDGSGGAQPIVLGTLRAWLTSGDPLLEQLAFHTAYSHPERIPELTDEDRLDICLCFLEKGLAGHYGNRIPDGPYTLAHTTLDWLREVSELDSPSGRRTLAAILSLLERLARNGDPGTRDVIVLGILEHAFEDPRMRVLFAGWMQDTALHVLYKEAAHLAGA